MIKQKEKAQNLDLVHIPYKDYHSTYAYAFFGAKNKNKRALATRKQNNLDINKIINEKHSSITSGLSIKKNWRGEHNAKNAISITHHLPSYREWSNSEYYYNKNTRSSAVTYTLVSNLIKDFFKLNPLNPLNLRKSSRIEIRLQRLSLNRILVSKPEIKQTNNKNIITIFVYNRNKKYCYFKLNEFRKKQINNGSILRNNKSRIIPYLRHLLNVKKKKKSIISYKRKSITYLHAKYLLSNSKSGTAIPSLALKNKNKNERHISNVLSKGGLSPALNYLSPSTLLKKEKLSFKLKYLLRNNKSMTFFDLNNKKPTIKYVKIRGKKKIAMGKKIFNVPSLLARTSKIKRINKNNNKKRWLKKNTATKKHIKKINYPNFLFIASHKKNILKKTYRRFKLRKNFLNKKKIILIKRKGLLFLKRIEKHKYLFMKAFKVNDKYFNFFKNKHYNNYLVKLYKKELIYLYYIKILYFCNLKYKNWFLIGLKNIISNIYKKNVEFNIVNMKYLHYNSDIFTEAISIRLKDRNNRLLRVLKKAIKCVNIPYFYPLLGRVKKNEYNKKPILSILKDIKYKIVNGVRIEAAGRLSKRLTASRSVLKYIYKGGLKDTDSSYKGISSVMSRGHAKQNTQFIKIGSKSRNGAFGLKGWISSY